jgi:hypothetical protein
VLGAEQEGKKKVSGYPKLGCRHLLRDHLLDLWLHVSVHCFSWQGKKVMRINVLKWNKNVISCKNHIFSLKTQPPNFILGHDKSSSHFHL